MNKRTLLIALVLVLVLVSGCLRRPVVATTTTIQAPTTTVKVTTPIKPQAKCGDGVCDESEQRNPKLCPKDCKKPTSSIAKPLPTQPGKCGDGICDAKEQNNPSLCPKDCGELTTSTIKPPLTQPGKCGNGICDADESCSSCPSDCGSCPVPSTESHFGVQGAIVNFPDEMKEAGIEITRDWIVWAEIEPEDNLYNWVEMDKKVQAANNAGIEVLGYFREMPIWARNMKNPKCNKTIKIFLIDACEPKDINDFREFAEEVAKRYDGKHGHGEMKYIGIFNEVQGFSEMNSTEYEPWILNGYQAVKQGNPNAQVLLGAVHSPLDFNGGNSGQSTDDFVDAMLRDYNQYYDIFNFHIYQHEDGSVLESIDYIKERMGAYNVNKPIWITETATYFYNVKCNNLDWYNGVAKGVIRRYAQALGNGVEKVFWFPFVALPTVEENPAGVECQEPTNFLKGGLAWSLKFDNIFHPRPAYYTYKTMTSKLAGFSSVEKITDTQYKFNVNGDDVYVLWCDSGNCNLPLEITGNVKVTDYLGNEETEDASQITPTESPIFVE